MASDLSTATGGPQAACAAQRPARQRDVLFGAGCGLLCFGLFPFSGSTVVATPGGPDEVARAFDAATRALSATFALAGLVCIVVSCVDLARARLRGVLLAVLVPLAIAAVAGGAVILRAAHANDLVTVLHHTRVLSFDEELRLEPAVNDLYCTAQARRLCDSHGHASVLSVLGLSSRAQVEAACFLSEQDNIHPSDLDPLTLISKPTKVALHWCGQYVATPRHEDALDLTQSPYQQHHAEVIDVLLHARVRRRVSAKLLMLLEWFAVPALGAMVWWLRTLSAVKIHVISPQVIV